MRLSCDRKSRGGISAAGACVRTRWFCLSKRHWLASQATVALQEFANETFYLASKAAPAVRRAVLEYFNRAGIDLKPEHEVHNVVHGISMITSTRAVMLVPAYTERYLPGSITTRPAQGEVPTLDLILAYHKANNSPILKLLLSRIGKLPGVLPRDPPNLSP